MSSQIDLHLLAQEIAQAAEANRQRSEALVAQATRLLALLERPEVERPVGEGARLDVPWVSQLGPGTNYAPGDCGMAALAMWLRYLGHDVTVDDVSRATGLSMGFRLSSFQHLQKAARAWGLELAWAARQSLDALRAELATGSPVIALVHYLSLPKPVRYAAQYPYSHWVTVVGYSAGFVVYHDPYFPPEQDDGGAFIEIPNEDFLTAWGNNHKAKNFNSDFAMIKGA
jgi:uncharacterized protein YvpB